MSRVRVAVGTRKGAFLLTSDGTRKRWDVSGPYFGGWEIYHVKASRRRSSASLRVAEQRLVRSDHPALGRRRRNLGTGRQQVPYEGGPGTHKWYDGTPHPWEFTRVWHLEPSLDRSRHGLCRRSGRGACSDPPTPDSPGRSCRACAVTSSGPDWHPGAGGLCLHTILLDPTDPNESWSRSPPPERSEATTPGRPGSRSTAGCGRNASRIRTPKSGIACIGSRCTGRGRTSSSCRSTGM